MGGEPFSEAHGGYTFCAVAALKLLGALQSNCSGSNASGGGASFDVSALVGWLARRQTTYEGGFSGRSNKLVDGCYSFWQGGAMAIASSAASECLVRDGGGGDDANNDEDPWLVRYRRNHQRPPAVSRPHASAGELPFPLLYDVFLLERYILLCAQEVTGGLRDKPSKPRDFYHTCYNLSGLSIAQHCSSTATAADAGDDDSETPTDVGFGDASQTLVKETHPCYNIRIDRVASILAMDWGKQ